MRLQELKLCNAKLKDAESDILSALEKGRAKAKQEQVVQVVTAVAIVLSAISVFCFGCCDSYLALFDVIRSCYCNKYRVRMLRLPC